MSDKADEREWMPNEKLTDSKTVGCCMECGEDTSLVWLDAFSFCSRACLDKFTREWAEDYCPEAKA